jgi:general L-amino acid transport system permease protein
MEPASMRGGTWLHSAKTRAIVLQVAAVSGVLAVFAYLAHNAVTNLAERGITGGFDFLTRAARFPIAESLAPYSPTDSFGWAFVVGLTNTLFISLLVIVASTVLGLFLALGRRSKHPLTYGLSSIFVEAMRNTPLVVQLLFWYALVTVGLPASNEALNPAPGVFLTDRGLFVPDVHIAGDIVAWTLAMLAGVAAVITATIYGRRRHLRSGQPNHYGRWASAIGLVGAVVAWRMADLHIAFEHPTLGRFNFTGGMTLTPELVAMLLGLTLYSTAFTGEIIRGGIDAIHKGQWEAGRAIGLSDALALRLIIIPQALRVIVPPMTSQYINIVKNTTLALVVGYPDIAFVTATTINQTGQAIEGIVILMLVFLAISLAGSVVMNWYNRRIALVER